MAEQPGNQTPNTPGVSETELRGTKVEELRQEAKAAAVTGTSSMRKDELVQEVAKARCEGDGNEHEQDGSIGAGPDGAHLRIGEQTSKSLKYSREVTSPTRNLSVPLGVSR